MIFDYDGGLLREKNHGEDRVFLSLDVDGTPKLG